MEKLKPCPFCGGKAVLRTQENWPDCRKKPIYNYGVTCFTEDCYCCDNDCYHDDEEIAVEKWNTRVEDRGE